jgi:hypothetical protein
MQKTWKTSKAAGSPLYTPPELCSVLTGVASTGEIFNNFYEGEDV